jgi:hypothetical protein
MPEDLAVSTHHREYPEHDSPRVHVENEFIFNLVMSAIKLATMRAGPNAARDQGSKGWYKIALESLVQTDEIQTILADTEVGYGIKLHAIEDIAFECTLRSVELKYYDLWCKERSSKAIQWQAGNAVSTLRRVLPALTQFAEISGDPRAIEYRALWNAVSLNFDFSPFRARLTWHTAARALAGLYKLHINSEVGWSAHGAGVRFIHPALHRIGVNCTPAAIEKSLDPKRHHQADPRLACPPYSRFKGVFDQIPPGAPNRASLGAGA